MIYQFQNIVTHIYVHAYICSNFLKLINIYVMKFVINKRKLISLLVYIDKWLNQTISIVEMVFICSKLRIDFLVFISEFILIQIINFLKKEG